MSAPRTLHPLSIPYRAVQTAGNLLWIVILAGFSGATLVEGPTGALFFGGAILVGIAAAVVWEVLYYRRFEYELTENTFDLRSGVVSRRDREIPYRRIQNVAISRNVIQRLLGVAQVTLETAGGSEAEAQLRYVSHREAERLQDELSRRKRRHADEERDATETEDRGTPDVDRLFSISRRELAVLGLVSVDLRVMPLLLVGLPAIAQLPGMELFLAGPLFVIAPLAAIVAYLLTALVSGILSVTNYYDFLLVRSGDELRYERGLLQRFSGTIPLVKVQTLTITENPLQRLVGYASLAIETAGYSPGESGGSQSAVPIAEHDRVVELARAIEPFEDPAFRRPPRRARRRYVGRYLLVLATLLGIGFAVDRFTVPDLPWYWLAAGVVAVPVAAHLKWKQLGYALGEDYVVTRAGFWNRRTKIVPYHRVQTVFDSQTIFQRRWNLATVTIDTAGSRSLSGQDAKAIDVDEATARQLREDVAQRLQESLADHTPMEDRLVDPGMDVVEETFGGSSSITPRG